MVLSKKRPPPLSKNDALEMSKKFLESGNVTFTKHLSVRMKERNFGMGDIFSVIENGVICKEPEWNGDRGEDNYFIEGKDIEEDDLTLRIAISTNEDLLTIITGY